MTPPYAFREDLLRVAGVWPAKGAEVTYVPAVTPEPEQDLAFDVTLAVAMTAGVVSQDLVMSYEAMVTTRPPAVVDPRFQGIARRACVRCIEARLAVNLILAGSFLVTGVKCRCLESGLFLGMGRFFCGCRRGNVGFCGD